ncbi:MAG TPA: hypothetical protein VEF04_16410 [Blastocatellia bacterium]|nr:hypothetical protein [Blastocatellia bacterium]
MQNSDSAFEHDLEDSLSDAPLGGSNFLVSAVLILKRQKKELLSEVQSLREQVLSLERQNAAFVNLSADRLLEKQG